MMSEGELKLILVQVQYEIKFMETRLPELSKIIIESDGLMERMKEKHSNIYFRLRKYIELRDKEKTLETDWLTTTGTEWRI